jgi:hypothetical protein
LHPKHYLDAAVLMYFREQFGSERKAAVAAIQRDEDMFAGLAWLDSDDDGPYPCFLTLDSERPTWELVAFLVGPGSDTAPPTAAVTAKVESDLSGRPPPALATAKAIRLYGERATAYRVAKETALSYRQALRVETWVKSGAVWWDATDGRVRPAQGFRLVKAGEGDLATVRLEQT